MNRNNFIRKSIGLTSFALISGNVLAGAGKMDMNEETDWENFSESFHHDSGVLDFRSNGGSPIPKKCSK